MSARLKRLANGALKLLYPTRAICMGCGTQAGFEREWLCEECRAALAKRWIGAAPPPKDSGIDGAAFAYLYAGPAGSMVRNLKYGGTRRLAEPMARAMAGALEAIQPTGAGMIVPVPMHPERQRRRGFNHAALLAERLGGRTGLPVCDVLVRTRNTRQQARLSDAQRLGNLAGAFALAGPVSGRRILLVDDVCTTGATAAGCAAVLKAGGAAAVYLLCFAAADRGGRDPDAQR